MTTKDYELIASVIENLPWSEKVRAITASRMARRLSDENPQFDKVAFMDGCGFVPVAGKKDTFVHKSRAKLFPGPAKVSKRVL